MLLKMKNYLNSRLPLLKILTGISFLLIYASGDKFGVFIFILLFVYPVLIVDGSSSFFSLSTSPFLVILTNMAFLLAIYLSVYSLLRAGFKKISNRSNDKVCLISIVILYVYVYKILAHSYESGFSMVTLVIFMLLSLITLIISFNNMMKR